MGSVRDVPPPDAAFVRALGKIAQKQPDVEVGVACKGTALESTTFRARKKAFLFVGAGNARLKLETSLAEAKKLEKKGLCTVGSNGWVAMSLTASGHPTVDVVERWIGESYRCVAGEPAQDTQPKLAGKKKTARRPARS
jgi:hypothetical protein